MNIDEIIKRARPADASESDTWFAWYPVATGALGTGGWVWLRRVWRNKCCGVAIYQILET